MTKVAAKTACAAKAIGKDYDGHAVRTDSCRAYDDCLRTID